MKGPSHISNEAIPSSRSGEGPHCKVAPKAVKEMLPKLNETKVGWREAVIWLLIVPEHIDSLLNCQHQTLRRRSEANTRVAVWKSGWAERCLKL